MAASCSCSETTSSGPAAIGAGQHPTLPAPTAARIAAALAWGPRRAPLRSVHRRLQLTAIGMLCEATMDGPAYGGRVEACALPGWFLLPIWFGACATSPPGRLCAASLGSPPHHNTRPAGGAALPCMPGMHACALPYFLAQSCAGQQGRRLTGWLAGMHVNGAAIAPSCWPGGRMCGLRQSMLLLAAPTDAVVGPA